MSTNYFEDLDMSQVDWPKLERIVRAARWFWGQETGHDLQDGSGRMDSFAELETALVAADLID